jgi:hypothetical protein
VLFEGLRDPAALTITPGLIRISIGIEDPDDDNQVVAAFKDLVKEKAYLGRGRGSADGGKGGESGAPESMNSLIRQAAGRE